MAKNDSNKAIQSRKSLHEVINKDYDSIVYEWFKQRQSDGVLISGLLLHEKVKQFHAELKTKEPCNFSSGWSKRF